MAEESHGPSLAEDFAPVAEDSPTLDQLEAAQDAKPEEGPKRDAGAFDYFGLDVEPGAIKDADSELPSDRQAEPAEESSASEESEEPEQLTAVDVASVLTGSASMTDEQALAIAQLEEERKLESGEAVADLAAEQDAYNEAIEQVRRECPGIDSEEAIEAMDPLFEEVAARYGEEVARHPTIVGQLYDAAGGSARFGPDSPDRLANREADAYEQALAGRGLTDPFGHPVEPEPVAIVEDVS